MHQVFDQGPVGFALGLRCQCPRQAQFGPHRIPQKARKLALVAFEHLQRQLLVVNQRGQGLRQAVQIPVRHIRLAAIGITALVVRVVANVGGVKAVQKLEGAVVDGQAQEAHVVGVHDAVAKAHRLPLRQKFGRAFLHLVQQGCVHIALPQRGALAAFGQVVGDGMVGQGAQAVGVALGRKVFKVTKAQEAGGHAGHHGSALHGFSAHRLGRGHQAQRPGGRDAQTVHGFAAQILADAGTQHGPPVATARIGRAACAFELNFLRALGRLGLAQPDGAAVAQLTRPLAKLVAAVDRGQGLRADHERIAREGLQVIVVKQFAGPAQFGAQSLVAGSPARRGHGRGLQGCEKPGAQLGQAVRPVQHGQVVRGTGGGFQRGR